MEKLSHKLSVKGAQTVLRGSRLPIVIVCAYVRLYFFYQDPVLLADTEQRWQLYPWLVPSFAGSYIRADTEH